MTATLAPPSWPAPSTPSVAWRFGQPWVGADRRSGVQWVLRRNCALTPQQVAAAYLRVCLLSLAIAAAFAWNGAPVVLGFAGLELLLLGAALLFYARHARDGDTLTLSGHLLSVEQAQGRSTQRTEFRAEWVSVEPSHGEGSLVELSGEGQRARVARFLRPEMRAAFAHELRLALRSVRQPANPSSDFPV